MDCYATDGGARFENTALKIIYPSFPVMTVPEPFFHARCGHAVRMGFHSPGILQNFSGEFPKTDLGLPERYIKRKRSKIIA